MNEPAGQGDPTDERIRRLELVTDFALSRLGVQELLERVRELLNVDTTAVLLIDPSGRFLTATAARGLEEAVYQGVRVPLGAGFAGRIAAEPRPVIIEEVDHTTVLNPILRSKGIRSLLGVPLLTSDRVLGVLHVGALRAYALDNEDPATVLAKLDREAQVFEAGIMATVLCGVLEPGRAVIRLSSAGHLSPLLAAPGRPTEYLDDEGLAKLRAAVHPEPAEQVCIEVMSTMVGAETPADDIAVLTLRLG